MNVVADFGTRSQISAEPFSKSKVDPSMVFKTKAQSMRKVLFVEKVLEQFIFVRGRKGKRGFAWPIMGRKEMTCFRRFQHEGPHRPRVSSTSIISTGCPNLQSCSEEGIRKNSKQAMNHSMPSTKPQQPQLLQFNTPPPVRKAPSGEPPLV